MQDTTEMEEELEQKVFHLYGLTDEEIKILRKDLED